MSSVKAVAWGVLVLVAVPASARADALTVGSSNGPWTFYLNGGADPNLRTQLTRYFRNAGSRSSLPIMTPLHNPTVPAPVTSLPIANPTPDTSLRLTPYFAPVAAPVATPAPVVAAPTPAPVVTPQPTYASISTTPIAAADHTQMAPIVTTVSNPPASAAPATPTADAFLNFTNSNFLEAGTLATGNPQAWYLSPSVVKAFGQAPTADQQNQFTQAVLADVQQTFHLAGLDPKLTLDPTVQASHMMSVVSGASYGPNTNAIGITDVGQNGFGFIDKLSYANDPTSLEWAVAHNISHELMHAFGVGIHPDQTGNYIDAATASWNLLVDPNATFSPAAASLITGTNFGNTNAAYSPAAVLGKQSMIVDGDQEILAPVPEPATWAAWSCVLLGGCYARRRATCRAA